MSGIGQAIRGALIIWLICARGTSADSRPWNGWVGMRHLFVFGDSYTWNGFTTSGPQPSAQKPLGITSPGSTSSGGPNWVDYLATTYNQSMILTYDFAFPGATVDASIVASSTRPVISMAEQVQDLYLPYYTGAGSEAHKVGWTAEDSLFAFFIGINDINFSYASPDSVATQTLIFSVYTDLMAQVYASGARNFLFLAVPPVDRAPRIMQLKSSRAVRRSAAAIAGWNRQLASLAVRLTQVHDEATAWVFDANGLFSQILDDPTQYTQTSGLRITDNFCRLYHGGTKGADTWLDGCEAAVNEYFWLDNLHPTPPVHKALASEIAKMLSRQSLWPSIWEMIAGTKCL